MAEPEPKVETKQEKIEEKHHHHHRPRGFHGFGPRCHAKEFMGCHPMFGGPCSSPFPHKERKCECGEVIPKRKPGEEKLKECPKCKKPLPKKCHGFGMRCHKMKKLMRMMQMTNYCQPPQQCQFRPFMTFQPPCPPCAPPCRSNGLEVHHYIHFGPPQPAQPRPFEFGPQGYGFPPMGPPPFGHHPPMGQPPFGHHPPMGPFGHHPPIGPPPFGKDPKECGKKCNKSDSESPCKKPCMPPCKSPCRPPCEFPCRPPCGFMDMWGKCPGFGFPPMRPPMFGMFRPWEMPPQRPSWEGCGGFCDQKKGKNKCCCKKCPKEDEKCEKEESAEKTEGKGEEDTPNETK